MSYILDAHVCVFENQGDRRTTHQTVARKHFVIWIILKECEQRSVLHLLKKRNYTAASDLVVELYVREFRSRTHH